MPGDTTETTDKRSRPIDKTCFNGARILLAEDDKLNQHVLREMLMDMQMPGVDGMEATLHLRRLPLLDRLPILAMTGNVSGEARALCEAAGMNDFLAKPVHPDVLYATLQRWISCSTGVPTRLNTPETM